MEDPSLRYAVLAEQSKKSHALVALKARYDELAHENKQLLEDRDKSLKETYEITEFLRQEIDKRSDQIQRLEKRLAEKADEVVRVREAEVAEAERRVGSTVKEWSSRYTALSEEYHNLKDEWASVQEFRSRQKDIESELEKLRVENQLLHDRDERGFATIERKFIEQNSKLRKEYEQRLVELKRSFTEDIDERMDESVKRILQQNRRMAEELRLHVEETEDLQREKDQLHEQKKQLEREVELNKQAEREHARRGSKQAKLIKESHAKVRALERSLGTLIRDYSLERKLFEEKHDREMADIHLEFSALQRLLDLKTQELKRIRRLAYEVLRQRGEVEHFLIQSIDYVRAQILKEKQQKPLRKTKAGARAKGGSSKAVSSVISSIVRDVCDDQAGIDLSPTASAVADLQQQSNVTLSASLGPSEDHLPEIRQSSSSGQSPSQRQSQPTSDTATLTCRESGSDLDKSRPAEQNADDGKGRVPPRARMDISELTWSEKEKVLRLLFAKINRAHQPSYFLSPSQEEIIDANHHEEVQPLPHGSSSDAGRSKPV